MYIVYTYNFVWHFWKGFPQPRLHSIYSSFTGGKWHSFRSSWIKTTTRSSCDFSGSSCGTPDISEAVLPVSLAKGHRTKHHFFGGGGEKKTALFWGTLGEKGIQSFDYTGYLVKTCFEIWGNFGPINYLRIAAGCSWNPWCHLTKTVLEQQWYLRTGKSICPLRVFSWS